MNLKPQLFLSVFFFVWVFKTQEFQIGRKVLKNIFLKHTNLVAAWCAKNINCSGL